MAMIPLVKKIADLVNDLKSYFVQKSGDTMTGNLKVTGTSGDVIVGAQRSDLNKEVLLCFGSGGSNHGIWSGPLNKWILYGNDSTVYLPEHHSGSLWIDPNSSIYCKRNDYTDATTPSGSMWMDCLVAYDNNASYSRFNLRQVAHSDGYQGLQLEAHRKNGSTDYYNGLRMEITSSGTRRVVVSEAAPWRNSIGAMYAVSANGYIGMGRPDGNTSDWIRTTSSGLIPYQSGNSSSLGTSTWKFANAHINVISCYSPGSSSRMRPTAWTLLSSGTGNRTFNSGSYEELLVVAKASNFVGSVVMAKAALTSSDQKVYTTGGYHGGSNGRGCELGFSTSRCICNACNVDSGGQTATLYVYGR